MLWLADMEMEMEMDGGLEVGAFAGTQAIA